MLIRLTKSPSLAMPLRFPACGIENYLGYKRILSGLAFGHFYRKHRNFSVLVRQCTSTATFQARQHFCHLRTVSGWEGAPSACPPALSALGSSQRLRKCWGQRCIHLLSMQGQSFPPTKTPANLLAPAKSFFLEAVCS